MTQSKESRKKYYENNKEKILQKTKERYSADPEKYMEYQREYRRKNRALLTVKNSAKRKEKQSELVKFLGDKCAHCHISFPMCVYDFHHIDPTTKLFTIGEQMGRSLKALKEEASKCILLCANCHRIIHDC